MAQQRKAKKTTHIKDAHPAHQPTTHKNIKRDNTLKNTALVILIVAIIALIVWSFGEKDTQTSTTSGMETVAAQGNFNIPAEMTAQMTALADNDPYLGAPDAPVTIVEFSDYQCPYCAKFYKETLPALKEKYITTGYVKFVYRDLPLSFHANAQSSALAAECANEQGAYWDYHDKLFANQGNLDINSLKKYAVDLGLDTAKFNDCLDSAKYASEVQEDATAASQNGISGTPGFVINGKLLSGAQPFDKFEAAICSHIPTAPPCADRPPEVTVPVTIITDKNCPTCAAEAQGISARTTELFPGAVYRTIDVSTQEAQQLIEDNNLIYVPTYLFDSEVEQTNAWKTNVQISGFFLPTTTGYRLRDEAVQASWFISEEKREEQEALFSNYPTENLNVLGASGDKPRLDYFVMAFCPYGNPADEAAAEVYALLGDTVEIVPHYIIDLQNGQMSSLHGAGEGNQGVRELCSLDLYGYDIFFDFVVQTNALCNSNNVETCWERAAQEAKLTSNQIEGIQTCFEDRWVEITTKQGTTNNQLKSLDVRTNQLRAPLASPTFLINGGTHNGGRDAESLKQALCSKFDASSKPAECDTALTGQTAQPVGNC